MPPAALLVAEDGFDCGILAFENPRRPLERQDAVIDARGFHDTAVEGQISRQHGEAAVRGEGMFGIATRITVRLMPLARSVRTMLADFDSLRRAGGAVSAVIASGLVPAALEMMDQSCVQVTGPLPSLRAQRSNPSLHTRKHGLLRRFAPRNDG